MKKIVLLLIITAISFSGCVAASTEGVDASSSETVMQTESKTEARYETQSETNTDTETEVVPIGDGEKLVSFVDFLNESGFVFGVGQGEVIDLIESFSVSGEPLVITDGLHFDYNEEYGYGGGFEGTGEGFDLYNDYYTYKGVTHIINRAFFSVQLDGIIYPAGIQLGDGFESVLGKLGIDDFRESFSPIEANDFKCVVVRNESLSLEYLDVEASQAYSSYGESCQLIFEEKNVTKNVDGSSRHYTRRVILYFAGEDLLFSGISAGTYIEY
jgi:hypothetical protein